MDLKLSSKAIKAGKIAILYDEGALSGVKKIAAKLASDLGAVFGVAPCVSAIENLTSADAALIEVPILIGTIGVPACGTKRAKPQASCILAKLEAAGLLDLSEIAGQREVYQHNVLTTIPSDLSLPHAKTALVIAGSDKRGTVYGIFAVSEKLGVSPFIDWLDVKPEKKSEFTISGRYTYTSKEPSVRFRGFFINDEWPAFGNWCNKRFGGFNAACYEHVFELLLRLKGNYMWPAMWSAIFPDDGPDLANAELADELGVVMGMSHHEPCLRQGEEYKYLRGPGSIYGDAWNFLSNEKGITRFWEDGLKRGGKFENVVTVGMRGEYDTAIMGKDATLKDNIDLLRKVLKTQNRLIRKYVNPDLDEVPRMLALYKEVEPYFYGDEHTPGLMGDPELEGVTLMLCDDNYGNLRTVPTPEMRDHKGGYGMYYHFDYHGFPISFEWFNTSHLAKVWEQMTTAYDFGIRDLWIVNVGDIFSNEYPLAYFLDLAYDFDAWGTSNKNSARKYTDLFVKKYFGSTLSTAQMHQAASLLQGYTRITSARRTEAMNGDVYAPFAYEETDTLLLQIDSLMKGASKLYEKLSGNAAYRFYEMIYLPLMANLNVQKMWLLTTQNHAYAKMGSTYAQALAEEIERCLVKDRKLVSELHEIHDGMWYGMGLSEHIGFQNWCEEGCQYPVIHTFDPANKPRIITSIPGTDQYTEGFFWTRRALMLPAFLDPRCEEGKIELSTACAKKVAFTVECEAKWIHVEPATGVVAPFTRKRLKVTVDRSKIKHSAKDKTEAKIVVHFGEGANEGFAEIRVPVETEKSLETWAGKRAKNAGKVFIWCDEEAECISMPAAQYSKNQAGAKGTFEMIPDYNRGLSAMKAYPQDLVFRKNTDAPMLTYQVLLPKDGRYTLRLMTNPSNPYSHVPQILCGVAANGGKMKKINMIRDGFAVGDGNFIWSDGVLRNLRETEVALDLKAGMNTIEITAISPNFVLTKLVLFPEGKPPMASYLGPTETYLEE